MGSGRIAFVVILTSVIFAPWASAGPDACVHRRVRAIVAPTNTEALTERYGVLPEELRFTPVHRYPAILHGWAALSPPRSTPMGALTVDPVRRDTIVIGGGPAGLAAALYLGEAKRSVLLLEASSSVGGLSSGLTRNGVRSANGSAYSAGPAYLEQYKIFQKIGLGDYKRRLKIRDPVDSFLWKGKIHHDVWSDESLRELPPDFAVFKKALLAVQARTRGFDPRNPLSQQLDQLSARDAVKALPGWLADLRRRGGPRPFAEYLPRGPHADPSVLSILDLYSRSALGETTDQISALAFLNFYASEIAARFAGSHGTGDIVQKLEKTVRRHRSVQISERAVVGRVRNVADGVEVDYRIDGNWVRVRASSAIYAAPLKLAPEIIEDLPVAVAQQIRGMKAANYLVHTVRVRGHPYGESFDLWLGAADHARQHPTDVIVGRWQEPGAPDSFSNDDRSVLTLYQPLGADPANNGMSDAQALSRAEEAVRWLSATMRVPLDVELIETSRWPYSIHIAEPGYTKRYARLREPVGRIQMSGAGLLIPEFETALMTGKRAAQRILGSDAR